MSVSSQVALSGPFVITALPQVIPVGFPFQQGSDLAVTDAGSLGTGRIPAVTLVLGGDYTVSGGGYNGANEMQSGSLTVVGTGANTVLIGDELFIRRNVPITQTSSFVSTGPLTMQIVEQALDKQATISQELNEKILETVLPGDVTNSTVLAEGSTVPRTLGKRFGEWVDVLDYGADPTGVLDSTSAIQEAITQGGVLGRAVHVPGGTYRLINRLIIDHDGVSFFGDGIGVTILNWSANVATDLIYTGFSSPGSARRFVSLEGFTILSDVTQTGGAAIHFQRVTHSSIRNVAALGNLAALRLHHGFWFDCVDTCWLDGFLVQGNGEGVMVNGETGGAQSELRISEGRAVSCSTGLHVGGGFGGLYVSGFAASICGRGMVIDQALSAVQNREIFLDPTCAFDASVNEGIYLNEAFPNGWLSLCGVWVASNQGVAGIRVSSAVGACVVNIEGGTLFSNVGDGLRVESTTAKVLIDDAAVRNNGGFGVNATNATNAVQASYNRMFTNTSGSYSTNVAYVGKIISSTLAAGSAVSLTTLVQADITTISLPPGVWDVSFTAMFDLAAATCVFVSAGASVTSATFGAAGTYGNQIMNTTTQTFTGQTVTCAPVMLSLGATTTVYLVGNSQFSAGTVKGYGLIQAQLVNYS